MRNGEYDGGASEDRHASKFGVFTRRCIKTCILVPSTESINSPDYHSRT